MCVLGFCNNDKDDEAYLNIEAYRQENDGEEAKKVGEARIDIYPCTDPKPSVNADVGENMYSKEAVSYMN